MRGFLKKYLKFIWHHSTNFKMAEHRPSHPIDFTYIIEQMKYKSVRRKTNKSNHWSEAYLKTKQKTKKRVKSDKCRFHDTVSFRPLYSKPGLDFWDILSSQDTPPPFEWKQNAWDKGRFTTTRTFWKKDINLIEILRMRKEKLKHYHKDYCRGTLLSNITSCIWTTEMLCRRK